MPKYKVTWSGGTPPYVAKLFDAAGLTLLQSSPSLTVTEYEFNITTPGTYTTEVENVGATGVCKSNRQTKDIFYPISININPTCLSEDLEIVIAINNTPTSGNAFDWRLSPSIDPLSNTGATPWQSGGQTKTFAPTLANQFKGLDFYVHLRYTRDGDLCYSTFGLFTGLNCVAQCNPPSIVSVTHEP